MTEQRVQRRLAAILAADVVGYSRLMGEDEVGTVNRLKNLRAEFLHPKAEEYGGRIVKTTGDGTIIEFGSAVDAVSYAVDVQRGMAERNSRLPEPHQIHLRLGINVGDIIIDDGDIFGDGVNVAARLEALAESGGICISDRVHDYVRGRIDVAFDDLGEQSVKNIVEPVRVFRVRLDAVSSKDPVPPPKSSVDKPSIAVLPFDNLSADPEQEYFSDGMAEDLITDLSKISTLSVAARNSSFSFKGRMPNVKDVAEKLGVAFVVEGSVRKMGDRLRINAQLIDAADGRHMWAERYDGNIEEIFDFQDRIRAEIVAALKLTLTPTDVVRTERKRTQSVEAYDLFLKGRTSYFQYTRESHAAAMDYLERAIAIDPDFADAHSYLSYCHCTSRIFMWGSGDDNLQRATVLARKGVELDPYSAIARTRLAWVLGWSGNFKEAVENYEQALSLEPDNAEVHAYYAETLNFTEETKKAAQLLERALQLEPLSPPSWDFMLGHSRYELGEHEEAIARFRRCIDRAPSFPTVRLYLACAYVETGRIDEARDQIRVLLESEPRYSENAVEKIYPYSDTANGERFLKNLRAARLPKVMQEDVTDSLPLPDKPSIAILPFQNMSGDPEQDYFADGMTEDIITELSRFEDLFVIARNTSFTFKGQAVDVKTVARELGVRFILEGSVRKAGERVRITSQLVKGQDGGHVWAERYDGAIGDVFELQEQVTSQVVGSIAPQITEFELERVGRGQRTFDDAHDRAWLAQETERSALRLADPRLLDRAIAIAVEAVEMNAKCGIAYQTICHAHIMKNLFRWGDEPEKSADLAEAWAKKFFSELPNSYMAYLSLGLAKLRKGHYEEANRDFLRAHNLNPNDSTVLREWAWCEASAGEFENAKKHAHMAIRLSPKDTQLGVAYLALAMSAFIEKDHSNFEVWADNAIQSQPHAPIRRALMIAHAAEVGNNSLLETHKGELMRFAPDFIGSLFRGENQLYQHPEHMAALLDGLRKAGHDG